MQSRLHSLIEVVAGICIGFSISVLAGRFIYPLYGMHPSWGANITVTAWFTVISLVRGYCVRRLFNWIGR